MLKFLRNKGFMKKLLWVVAGVIIISFGFLGQSSLFRNSQKPQYAGKIFGTKIPLDQYDFQYQHTLIQALLQYGPEFKKVSDLLNLYSQTWDRIILLHEARHRNIQVKDEDVILTIQSNPLFFRNGIFDKGVYDYRLLYDFRMKARDFEEGTRDTLTIIQLLEQETQEIDIAEQDIFEKFRWDQEKVQVSYVLFSPEQYTDQVVFDEIQAKNYFLSHRQDFLLPPTVDVEFLHVAFPEIDPDTSAGATADPSPDAEEATADTDTVTAAETPALDGVDPETASEAAKTLAYELARNITESIQEDTDFQELAQTFQVEYGSTGFFSMEKPDLSRGWSFPLIQTLFQLEAEKFVGPFELADGYEIMRIKQRREAYIPDYLQAQEEVKTQWTRSEAMTIARAEAEAAQGQLKELFDQQHHPDFMKTAKDLGLELFQTPLFNRGQYLPTVGLSRDFQDTAFSLSEANPFSDIVQTEKGPCLLWLDDAQAADPEDFEKEKEQYREQILLERKQVVFSEFISRLRQKAQLVDHIPDIMGLDNKNPGSAEAQSGG